MIRTISFAAAVVTSTATFALPAGAATGAGGAGADFGRHITTHAHEIGFARDHNPGDHRGFAGFEGCRC